MTGSSQRRSGFSTWGSSEKADLYKVLWRAFRVDYFVANNMFAHGQVKIDGYVVPAPWAKNHWTTSQLSGRTLSCVYGQVRLYGPAGVCLVVNQQLEFG